MPRVAVLLPVPAPRIAVALASGRAIGDAHKVVDRQIGLFSGSEYVLVTIDMEETTRDLPNLESKAWWHPAFHFAANSWINDPCAPGYDVSTKTYHLFYQCNPSSCEWGNMSWGHIVSKDMLTWTPAPSSPALSPDHAYDRDGVFTGCWMPDSTPGNTSCLTVAYSSVTNLPFHWSTPPYPRNAAGISIARSTDRGASWHKSPNNPVLAGEPAGVQVMGFRDPYVTEWPAVDKIRGGEPSLYGLVSGGIVGVGPTTFLYQIPKDDPEQWRYLCPLVELPLRYQPSTKWGGNFGVNWECVNVMTLRDGSDKRTFLIIGAEGDVEKPHVDKYARAPRAPVRTVRAQLWMAGHLAKTPQGEVRFVHEHGGYFDHGVYYAANSFVDPRSGRRIVHGWVPEEDIPMDAAKKKGWNGSLAIPREVFLLRLGTVVGTVCGTPLADITPFEVKQEPSGPSTVVTLGVRPIREMEQQRQNCDNPWTLEAAQPLPLDDELSGDPRAAWLLPFQLRSPHFELEATIHVKPACQAVGLHLRHSRDMSVRTSIIYDVLGAEIRVDRSCSTADQEVNTCPDAGPFTLLKMGDSASVGAAVVEKLNLRVFLDGDVLEVFANDRFALATMVYTGSAGGESLGGISLFATGLAESALVERLRIWDGLALA